MATSKYTLEIYEPGSSENAWVVFQSDTPFMSFHAGDLINPQAWGDAAGSFMDMLRVVNVEHIVWQVNENTDAKHKLCIFTEVVKDTDGVRLKKP